MSADKHQAEIEQVVAHLAQAAAEAQVYGDAWLRQVAAEAGQRTAAAAAAHQRALSAAAVVHDAAVSQAEAVHSGAVRAADRELEAVRASAQAAYAPPAQARWPKPTPSESEMLREAELFSRITISTIAWSTRCSKNNAWSK